jgi:hypothetical protein
MAFQLADQKKAEALEAHQVAKQAEEMTTGEVTPEEEGAALYDALEAEALERALVAAERMEEQSSGEEEEEQEGETSGLSLTPIPARIGVARRRSSVELASRPKEHLQAEIDELKRLRETATRNHGSLDRQIEKLQRGLLRVQNADDEISLQEQLQNLSGLEETGEEELVKFEQDEVDDPTTDTIAEIMATGSQRKKKIRSRQATKMLKKGDSTSNALAAARAEAAAREVSAEEGGQEGGGGGG